MKRLLVVALMIASVLAFAQDKPAPTAPASCLAVKPIGSHAVRNVFLFGIAGAIVSKQQYQVMQSVNYLAATYGTKYHGNDLQVIQQSGVKVIITDKDYKGDTLLCEAPEIPAYKLSSKQQEQLELCTSRPNHKAFAVSDNNHFGVSYGQRNEDLALDIALEYCRKYAGKGHPCKVIMVDDRKVD